jgi:hypothetical protein
LTAAAGLGIAAAGLTTSPAVAIGAMIYAGLAGFFYGAVGGIDRADLDDSVDLPAPEEYQRLINDGKSLVLVCGSHDEVMRAETLVKDMPQASSHVHRFHGYLFHEHSARPNDTTSAKDDLAT